MAIVKCSTSCVRPVQLVRFYTRRLMRISKKVYRKQFRHRPFDTQFINNWTDIYYDAQVKIKSHNSLYDALYPLYTCSVYLIVVRETYAVNHKNRVSDFSSGKNILFVSLKTLLAVNVVKNRLFVFHVKTTFFFFHYTVALGNSFSSIHSSWHRFGQVSLRSFNIIFHFVFTAESGAK